MNKLTSTFQQDIRNIFGQKRIMNIMHLTILVLSIFLVVFISIDTFKNILFYRQPQFIKVQLWICIFFLLDFFIELIVSEQKWHFFWTHLLFLIVSVPYQYLIMKFNIPLTPNQAYLVGFIPLVRGAYAMAIVVGWFANSSVVSLVVSYLMILICTVYFASVIFFVFERGVNPDVIFYKDALWWAAMDVTTVGCSIEAVTTIGRILSVLLAALGMMMFPIFTVYITSVIRTHNTQKANEAVMQATNTPPPTREDVSE